MKSLVFFTTLVAICVGCSASLAVQKNPEIVTLAPGVTARNSSGVYVMTVDCSTAPNNLRYARNAIRGLARPLVQPVRVELAPGVDCLPETAGSSVLDLDMPHLDSGSPGKPITYTTGPTSPGRTTWNRARLNGGTRLTPSLWSKVNSPASEGLPQGTWVYDLTQSGFTSPSMYGGFTNNGWTACTMDIAELFFNDKPMTLARYPNIDSLEKFNGPWTQWLRVGSKSERLPKGHQAFDVEGDSHLYSWVQQFYAGGDQAQGINTTWLHGYWVWDWADNYLKLVNATNSTTRPGYVTLTLKGGFMAGNSALPTARFFAIDAKSELDQEGEYWIDKQQNKLFFLPPSGYDPSAEDGYTVVSMTNRPLINLAGAVSHVNFEDLEIGYGRGYGILQQEAGEGSRSDEAASNRRMKTFPQSKLDIEEHRRAEVDRFSSSPPANKITLRNVKVHNVAKKGILFSNVHNATIQHSVLTNIGCAALQLNAGKTKTLASGHALVETSTFSVYARWARAYEPAIKWSGVGNTYRSNFIHDAPSKGIYGGGNNHIFANNTLDTVLFEARDSGAYYSYHSWVERGNMVVNNTFRNVRIQEPTALGYDHVQCVYLDGQFSGVSVINNTMEDSDTGVLLGGGRQNIIEGNTFRNLSFYGIDFLNEGAPSGNPEYPNSCTYNATFNGSLPLQLFAVDYTRPPYSTAYPDLPSTLQDHPCVPVGNILKGNSWCDCAAGFMRTCVLGVIHCTVTPTNASVAKWHSILEDNHHIDCP